MNSNQIMIAIYSYLFHRDAQLENEYIKASKYALSKRSTSAQIFGYWCAKLKYEHFREFSRAISDILSFYEAGED